MLTPGEFAILLSLARAKGRVKTRDHLLAEIRDREYEVFDRAIDVQVSALRRKLGDDPKSPRFIRTVRSAGYMLVDPDAPPRLSRRTASIEWKTSEAAFSLRWKILAWFFVNLAVLGAGAFSLFARAVPRRHQFAARRADRRPARSHRAARSRPSCASYPRPNGARRWTARSPRGARRGLRAALYRNNGRYLAGDIRTRCRPRCCRCSTSTNTGPPARRRTGSSSAGPPPALDPPPDDDRPQPPDDFST